VLAQDAGLAIAGASAVGVFSGLTRLQSAYLAILAGWWGGRSTGAAVPCQQRPPQR